MARVGERCHVGVAILDARQVPRTVVAVHRVLAVGVGDLRYQAVHAVGEGDRPTGGIGDRGELARRVAQRRGVAVGVCDSGELPR